MPLTGTSVPFKQEDSMRVLEIGPSETRARGGMSEVIRNIRESEVLGGDSGVTRVEL